ncbi:PREDICTED: odorant receptor Or2-like [Trachymyrmex cornetzi]|uniref:odorant receptor Or2-like n=1 Tax=Trachymyrmex cornetzi TaxID=471704 RepID=UPI00084F6B8D|nr:PREDICTED: odorant receptor Or2-like [Trachymyrmex cornetzi]
MQMFSLNFFMYTICGMWRPIEWTSKVVNFLYNVFNYIVLLLEYFTMLTQFLDFLFVIDNVDDFVANSIWFVSFVDMVCKATVVVIRRNAIISLIQVLLKGPCKPQDEDEIAIQTKFDKFVRLCSMKYLFLGIISLIGVTIGSVFKIMHGQLPCRIWLPFDYNVSLVFWIVSIQQIIAIIFGTFIAVATDTLVSGLILETCVQLEIFENRLHKLINNKTVKYLGNALCSLNEDKTRISKCIRHHLSIYKYAKTVNIIFNQMLFVQFFASILVLCSAVYYLSTHITELSAIVNCLVYTIGLFVQIYVYCWSGNEVILKSMSVGNAIYCMDWPLLSVNEKKELLIVMIRSTVPIKFTSSFLITLSLQSYSNILKTSYSVFNVLKK